MVDKHSLNCEVRELKLGSSFTNNKASQYHTIKYDFKPASVDVNKMATVDVGTNNQVTVTVPHLDGAGVPQTVFKGNQRPYTKECVLIIDRVTGEITLEKLSSNIQVKKTRQETSARPRPLTPAPADLTNTTARSTSRTRVATNKRTTVPVPNPMSLGGALGGAGAPQRFAAAKPSGMMRSPPRVKTSPPQAAPWAGGGNSTLASLPMIGLDEPSAAPAPAPAYPPPGLRLDRTERPERHERNERQERTERQERERSERERSERERSERERSERERSERERSERERSERERQELRAPPPQAPVPVLPPAPPQDDSSSSSSSDSGSDSGSDSDSDDEPSRAPAPAIANGTSGNPALSDVLNDDLCLSESGSDSD